MIQQSDEIVVATALHSHAELLPDGDVNTIVELRVEKVLKGTYRESDVMRLYEPDGIVEKLGIGSVVPGVPQYDDGQRYLVFAGVRNNGRLVTWGMSLGRFRFVPAADGSVLLMRSAELGFDASNFEQHVEVARDAAKFLNYIHGIVFQTAPPQPDYFVTTPIAATPVAKTAAPDATFTAASYMSSGAGRWSGSTITWRTAKVSSAPPNTNGTSGANAGMNAWSNNSGSNIHYSNAGNDDTLTKGLLGGSATADGKNTILYGDPNNELSGPYAGALGLGGQHAISSTLTNTVNGETFSNTLEGDVVIKGDFGGGNQQVCLNVIVTHELGHTLGFRHADLDRSDNNPCSAPLDCSAGTSTGAGAGAVMTSVTNCSFSSTLQPWDKAAVNTLYPGACSAPAISTQPSGTTITSGNSTTLSVAATGTAPFTYQWYIGNPPSTTNTAPNGTGASIQVSPTSTTTYWVQVTNACGSANSNAATVTVNGSCPTITVGNPTSQDLGNGSFQLSVTASGGSGLTFTWFEGGSVGSGSQVGTGNPFTINNVTSARTFWVQVGNSCGNTTNSPRTITVGSGGTCVAPSIVVDPPDQSVVTGGTVQLSFDINLATNPVTFTWFRGISPDESNPVGSGKTITSPAITATTNFWAKAQNSCGIARTRTVTITATAVCTPPSITAVSSTLSTLTPGNSTTLSVSATGTSLTYQWYRGNSGDTSNLITGATSPAFTDSPSVTTAYWVRVSSGCGAAAADSQTVTVTVSSNCVAPAINPLPTEISIYSGSAATLTVTASAGTAPLHYSWFQGAKGDTSKPVGTDAASFTTDKLTTDTKYFVTVQNACGTVSSETVTVKVLAPRRRPSRR